jgi:hypothetical protein
MLNLKIEIEPKSMANFEKRAKLFLTPDEIKKVFSAAAKRAADAAKAETVRGLSALYTLSAAEIRKTITAGKSGGGAVMQITDGTHPLIDFKGVTPRKPSKKPKPVTAQIKKGGGQTLAAAFIAQTASGHIGAFERKTEKRLPVKQLFGPTTVGMFKASESVNEAVVQYAATMLNKRIEHEISRAVNK